MRLLEWLLRRSDGRGIDDLSRRLKMPAEALRRFPIEYRRFTIPKRTKGIRVILSPSEDLRRLQRRILHRLLDPLAAHPAATGFERGQSIVTNALPHAGQAAIVKMDLKDFFPSIDERRVRMYFRSIGWDYNASDVLTRLCTHEGRLPQGAPTSPRLSNLVNFRLDVRLARLARTLDAAYTRYADDLTFSLPDDSAATVRRLVHIVNIIIRDEGYEPHWREKLSVRRRCDRQVVTGLVVNDRVHLPRNTRRWLRAVEHRLATRGVCTIGEERLEGWRALTRMIERQTGREHPKSPEIQA